MTPLEALRALPELVERRAGLRLELSNLETELGEVATALSVHGGDGHMLVTCAIKAAGEPAVFVDELPLPAPEIVRAEVAAEPEIAAAVDEPVPADAALRAALSTLRDAGYDVMLLGDGRYDVNSMRLTPSRVIEKAAAIRDHGQRAATTRRSAA